MRLVKTLIHYTYRPYLIRYLKKDRWHTYDRLRIMVRTGVFHPGFFFSSRFLLEALRSADLQGKSFLELGCGSGLISVWSARAGAIVTASDINPKAVSNTSENMVQNDQKASVLVSDLFEAIPPQQFDYIIVNPPYYPQKPTSMREQAWFCGEDFEYFQRFFQQVGNFMHTQTKCLMSLSEDCDIAQVSAIAQQHGMRFELFRRKRTGWEWHYLFRVNK